MKKLIFNLSLAATFAFALSCSEEAEDAVLQTTNQGPTPLPLEQLFMTQGQSILTESATKDSKEIRVWEDRDSDDEYSQFYQDGNKVFEEDNGRVIFNFDVQSQGTNFVYIIDRSRNFRMAFPIWNEYRMAHAYYYSTNNRRWVQWRQFRYVTKTVTFCNDDTEAPTVSSEKCRKVGDTYICNKINVYDIQYPAKVSNTAVLSLRTFFSLNDNCDNNLKIVQTPAPGFVVRGPQTITMSYVITDSEGNSIKLSHPREYRR